MSPQRFTNNRMLYFYYCQLSYFSEIIFETHYTLIFKDSIDKLTFILHNINMQLIYCVINRGVVYLIKIKFMGHHCKKIGKHCTIQHKSCIKNLWSTIKKRNYHELIIKKSSGESPVYQNTMVINYQSIFTHKTEQKISKYPVMVLLSQQHKKKKRHLCLLLSSTSLIGYIDD
ncbi:hypothetical protein AGLY_002868 [Aphis glycines]|uniref:Uncharacterized protein n=1 Tax=Aphis glycines TaxID=307491 RepID=A0A6G0U1W6_APHGL|nr:hypothetical protein AGLY_002868 [Aphis glycines]